MAVHPNGQASLEFLLLSAVGLALLGLFAPLILQAYSSVVSVAEERNAESFLLSARHATRLLEQSGENSILSIEGRPAEKWLIEISGGKFTLTAQTGKADKEFSFESGFISDLNFTAESGFSMKMEKLDGMIAVRATASGLSNPDP